MHKEHGIFTHDNTLGSHRDHSGRRGHEAREVDRDISMVEKLLPDVEAMVEISAE